MAHNRPLKLTQTQSALLKQRLEALPALLAFEQGCDLAEVELELAMIAARYAVRAGIIDPFPEPGDADAPLATAAPVDPVGPPAP